MWDKASSVDLVCLYENGGKPSEGAGDEGFDGGLLKTCGDYRLEQGGIEDHPLFGLILLASW